MWLSAFTGSKPRGTTSPSSEYPVPRIPQHKKVMKMKTKTTNPRIKKLVKKLRAEEGLWKALSKELSRANRRRAEVNTYKLESELENGETALVPGKVIGHGEISKKINVAALNYSQSAKEKIEKAGGKTMTIEQALEEKIDKSKARIIK